MQGADSIRPDQRAALVRAVAINYARLLAVKDEYEVARLYADPAFAHVLARQFDGVGTVTYHLAPPFLPGRDAAGRPRKRTFGPWVRHLFGLLARLRRLRGTAFDVFGYTAERRRERVLIADYESDMELVRNHLTPANQATALALLAWPEQVRGFGPVKAEAMARAAEERAALRQQLALPVAVSPSPAIASE